MGKNISYRRSTADRLAIKGIVSADGTTITYNDDDNNEQIADIIKCAELFAGESVTITFALKGDSDISDQIIEDITVLDPGDITGGDDPDDPGIGDDPGTGDDPTEPTDEPTEDDNP